ncbi:hypothetical protein [Desulfitobacterium hafniense]|uniref:hypothetical protein n=1 Tax=Desulfitobacterium hafniense TaxID=49338 RepID=UPI001F617AB1|nr:hypothetical protein [Desulfitobacterium hafniense]
MRLFWPDGDVAPLFKGLFDTVSISLNAPDAAGYVKLCRPQAGEDVYYGMLDFAREVKKYVPHVVLSAVDVLPESEIETCRKIADQMGTEFRIRHYQ